MIKATKAHYITLDTTDMRTASLADAIHNMHEWRLHGFITEETFIRIHEILRANIGTENFIGFTKYCDNREEDGEYHIILVEFPEKADGTIRKMKKGEEENEYYLLTKEEEK